MQALQHVYDMDRKWYLSVNNDFATNGNIGNLEFGGTRWSMQGEWKIGYKDTRGYEAEGRLGRYIGEKQWLYPYIGADWTCRKGGGRRTQHVPTDHQKGPGNGQHPGRPVHAAPAPDCGCAH